jgi:hypothetical protein
MSPSPAADRHAFRYVDSDVPEGLTIATWRRERAVKAPARSSRRLLRRAPRLAFA